MRALIRSRRWIVATAFAIALNSNDASGQSESRPEDIVFAIPFTRDPDPIDRYVDCDGGNPCYVACFFSGTLRPRNEFFRIDSTSYLYLSYGNDTNTAFDYVMSSGNVYIAPNRTDSVVNSLDSHITAINGSRPRIVQYFRALTREGLWKEYADSVRYPRTYWTGHYKADRRTGIWRLMNDASPVPLEELDYTFPPTNTKR